MNRAFLSLGACSGALAVGLGAFGAHGLKKIVSPEAVAVFQTGVQYQMYHTLALLIVGILFERIQNKWLLWSGYLFSFGILFFSGSLYLITGLTTAGKIVPAAIGAITPVGGLLFILAWLCLLFGVFRKN
jgi:uncharacterized membrane protein YgdD (TMEM256/DUF423 family)